jgi:hypothetical protein
MIFTAASMSVAFKSSILVVAISSNCARVTLPTFTVFGLLLPFAIPTAFLSKIDAGGVLVIKVKLLSLKTEITTGTQVLF